MCNLCCAELEFVFHKVLSASSMSLFSPSSSVNSEPICKWAWTHVHQNYSTPLKQKKKKTSNDCTPNGIMLPRVGHWYITQQSFLSSCGPRVKTRRTWESCWRGKKLAGFALTWAEPPSACGCQLVGSLIQRRLPLQVFLNCARLEVKASIIAIRYS